MGAFDTYEVQARCPRCSAIHHLGGQTKLFLPDFGDHHGRHFTPDRPQPLSYPPSDMWRDPVWDDQWWRVREAPEPNHLSVLVDLDETFCCSCAQPLAPVLRFSLDQAAPSATLVSAKLLDALADEVACHVDLASAESMVPWTGNFTTFTQEVRALATSPPHVRVQQLRRALARRFEGHEQWAESPDEGWTLLVGPMCCEACGEIRKRSVGMSLTHPQYETSVLGDGWRGGALHPGMRVSSSMAWRTEDEDRGFFVRLRHPLPERTLTLCGGPEHWGCACGAGRAAVLLHLDVDDQGFSVRDITLRALRSRSDLDDIDLGYAPHCSRGRVRDAWPGRWRPADRAEALTHLLRTWNIPDVAGNHATGG